MADDPKAGTTEPGAPGGGSTAGTGAATGPAGGAEGGSEPEKVTIPAAEYHALQGVAETKNALAQELARTQAELEAARTRPPTTGADDASAQRAEIGARDARISRLRMAANAGNEDALVMVDVLEEAQRAARQSLFLTEMSEIPQADRQAVKDMMKETGAPSPAVAHKLLRGEKYGTLEQKVADLERLNKASVGRELKMIELKKRIEELESKK